MRNKQNAGSSQGTIAVPRELMATLLAEQAKIEADRFALLEKRDGKEVALAWAIRTVNAYQDAVANPQHFAASKEYRAIYEASISALKALVEKAKSGGEKLG